MVFSIFPISLIAVKKFTNYSPFGRHANVRTHAYMLTCTVGTCNELLLSFMYVFESWSKRWIKHFITHWLFSPTLFWLQFYLLRNPTVYVLLKFVRFAANCISSTKKLRVFYIIEQRTSSTSHYRFSTQSNHWKNGYW